MKQTSQIDDKVLLRKFLTLKTWVREGERAPHKPLLLLLGLSRLLHGEARLASFQELDPQLKQLLSRYGPPRKTIHPEYPFWRLQSDGIWEVTCDAELRRRRSNSDVLRSELLSKNAMGGFPDDIWSKLKRKPQLPYRLCAEILKANFPETMHAEIVSELQIQLPIMSERDPEFRQRVLDAYGHKCAICGYKVEIGGAEFGLEAAHIRWHIRGGPSQPSNGIALCAIHHKALDYGVIGLTEGRKIKISSQVHGTTFTWFDRYIGKALPTTSRREWLAEVEHIRWHDREVFRGPAKEMGTR